MSLQARLALFIAAAIAVALLLQGVTGYLAFRQQAYASLDRDLRLYVSRVQNELLRRPGFRSNPRDPRGPLGTLSGDFVASARVIFQGEVVVSQATFPDDIPLALEHDPATFGVWRVTSISPREVRDPALVIQAAVSSREVTSGLERYRRTLAFTVLGVSVLGAVVALRLSRPALRPLQHLLDTARNVATSGDLSLRVPAAGGGELGELGTTFNRMLGRLAAFRQRESTFTRNASHELRTPLTALTLQLSAYHEGDVSAEEALAVVEQEVARMTRLSEALLVLAREGRAERADIDLARLAQDVARNADVMYRGLETLGLSANPVLLRQALDNLVGNALKHAPGADVTLTVDTLILERQAAGDAMFAVLSVIDTGPGLSGDARTRAHEAFYRAPGTMVPGSGLGLTVVAQVAEVHGGWLELSPTYPHGLSARLWLELP